MAQQPSNRQSRSSFDKLITGLEMFHFQGQVSCSPDWSTESTHPLSHRSRGTRIVFLLCLRGRGPLSFVVRKYCKPIELNGPFAKSCAIQFLPLGQVVLSKEKRVLSWERSCSRFLTQSIWPDTSILQRRWLQAVHEWTAQAVSI